MTSNIPSGHSHSFDTGVAESVGINAAIVFNHIIYWLRVNAVKGQNIIEGKVWMYETMAEMASFLKYLTAEEVRKALKKLVDAGLLIKGNHNKNSFDRTLWYTLEDQDIIGIKKVNSKRPYDQMDAAPRPPLYIQEEHHNNNRLSVAAGAAAEADSKEMTEEPETTSKTEGPLRPEVVIRTTGGKSETITFSDFYRIAVQKGPAWPPDAMNYAWRTLCEYQGIVHNWWRFLEGTVEKYMKQKKSKNITRSKSKDKSCQETQKSKDTSASTSETATSELPSHECISLDLIRQFFPGYMPPKTS